MSDNTYFVGLDLGQARDYTAVAVIEQLITKDEPDRYRCGVLKRIPLGTPYPEVVKLVTGLMNTEPLLEHGELIIDATGVGRPVVDMFRDVGLSFTAVSIHGGNKVSHKDGFTHVPKSELVRVLRATFGQQRIEFDANLREVPTLIDELLNFQRNINDKAHESFGCWRHGTHDDLVLAVALAVWKATRPVIKSVGNEFTNRET